MWSLHLCGFPPRIPASSQCPLSFCDPKLKTFVRNGWMCFMFFCDLCCFCSFFLQSSCGPLTFHDSTAIMCQCSHFLVTSAATNSDEECFVTFLSALSTLQHYICSTAMMCEVHSVWSKLGMDRSDEQYRYWPDPDLKYWIRYQGEIKM